ncbi:MAG: peptidylprolyl isomerase [Clostridia bacterium]|nr:peptidylprolyl isomerase [Clostridia bacterium]
MKKIIAILMAVCLLVAFCGCEKASDDRVVATIGNENVYFWELSFFLDSVKAELINQAGLTSEAEIEDFWANTDIEGTPAKEVAKNKALEQAVLFRQKVILAKNAGCTLNETQLAEIKEQLKQTRVNFGGEEEFKKALNEAGLTPENYESLMKDSYLVDSYMQKLSEDGTLTVTDEKVSAFFTENPAEFRKTVTAKHILIGTVDENRQPKSEAEIAQAEVTAKDLYEKITAGTLNYDAAMNEYSEDPGLATNPDGYTFGRGEMVEVFETTSFNAEIGKVCEPVLSEFGWHIILVTDADEYPFEEVSESIRYQLLAEDFEAYCEDAVKEFKVTTVQKVLDSVKF